MIGSILRIDPAVKKLQVICVAHTRELVKQISDVYSLALKFAPEYKILDLTEDYAKPKGDEQVIITTIGKLLKYIGNPRKPVDLSRLRMFILDEADNFFMDRTRENETMDIHKVFQTLP